MVSFSSELPTREQTVCRYSRVTFKRAHANGLWPSDLCFISERQHGHHSRHLLLLARVHIARRCGRVAKVDCDCHSGRVESDVRKIIRLRQADRRDVAVASKGCVPAHACRNEQVEGRWYQAVIHTVEIRQR